MRVTKTVVLLLSFAVFTSNRLAAQTKDADVANARILGKYFYDKGDYLNAYKFLLIYKYSHLDSLNTTACKSELQSVNNAIAYSEKYIKNELSAGSIEAYMQKAKGFKYPPSADSLKEQVIKNAPKLN